MKNNEPPTPVQKYREQCNLCKNKKTNFPRNGVFILKCPQCNGLGFIETVIPDTITFYLDQNIISEMRADKTGNFKKIIPQRGGIISYVYSDQTLIEITNSKRPEEYLDVLRSCQARKFVENSDLQIGTPLDFTFSGKAYPLCDYKDPDIFYQKTKSQHNKKESQTSNHIFYRNIISHVAYLLGVKIDITPNDIAKDNSLIVNTIRKQLELDKGQANNKFRTSDNPIAEIWSDIIRPNINNQTNITITEDIFFGFLNPSNVTQDYLMPYVILNIIGYYSDSNKKLENNLTNFLIDGKHIDMAKRADAFMSYDKNLAYRAAAIYKWKSEYMTVFLKKRGEDDIQNVLYTHSQLLNINK